MFSYFSLFGCIIVEKSSPLFPVAVGLFFGCLLGFVAVDLFVFLDVDAVALHAVVEGAAVVGRIGSQTSSSAMSVRK